MRSRSPIPLSVANEAGGQDDVPRNKTFTYLRKYKVDNVLR